jgi:hypothetical protein
MKKLLSLVLVLALASWANAMILQISVNGDPEPIDSQITLLPSQEVELDITSPDGFVNGDATYWALVVISPGTGTITGGVVHIPPAPDASMMLAPEDMAEYFPGAGVYGSIDSWAGNGGATAGVYYDGMIFHCDGPGDAIVQLLTTDWETVTVLDQVIIHQIPEPATIALLSLGGLLLRRKK